MPRRQPPNCQRRGQQVQSPSMPIATAHGVTVEQQRPSRQRPRDRRAQHPLQEAHSSAPSAAGLLSTPPQALQPLSTGLQELSGAANCHTRFKVGRALRVLILLHIKLLLLQNVQINVCMHDLPTDTATSTADGTAGHRGQQIPHFSRQHFPGVNTEFHTCNSRVTWSNAT